MTEQEQVQVTVEDIEAADLFDVHWYADFDRKQADELAKAFARHRHTVTAEALEAMREALLRDLNLTLLANIEAPTDWIDGFEACHKRVRAALEGDTK
jgi:hypothetical protein